MLTHTPPAIPRQRPLWIRNPWLYSPLCKGLGVGVCSISTVLVHNLRTNHFLPPEILSPLIQPNPTEVSERLEALRGAIIFLDLQGAAVQVGDLTRKKMEKNAWGKKNTKKASNSKKWCKVGNSRCLCVCVCLLLCNYERFLKPSNLPFGGRFYVLMFNIDENTWRMT